MYILENQCGRIIKVTTKTRFNDIFVISGDHGPGCGQSQITLAKINQNYECFQIILEKFINEFNQK